MATDPEDDVLSAAQHVRIKALTAARNVLVARTGLAGSGAADPIDLVSLARYIEHGTDPYTVRKEDQ